MICMHAQSQSAHPANTPRRSRAQGTHGDYIILSEFVISPTPQPPPRQSDNPHHVSHRAVSQWLNELIFIFSPKHKLTRLKLLEKAANQDGGAHVDATLDPNYERLQSLGGIPMSLIHRIKAQNR